MSSPASPLSLAVIGHVNHGKTALVRALTGMETDRLAEEKSRGLSITLGFAWRDYPGVGVEFLDAPGHEDFLRAMVMGAAGARATLLVVSAVEGFGRQTREHLSIAGLLGIPVGVVAITKGDRLPPEDRQAFAGQVAADLAGSFLAGEPMVFCSAVTGEGLEALHSEIQALAVRAPPPEPLPGAFLPLDRVFSLTGAGTVVTGTLLGGPLRSGEEAVLQPSGRPVGLRQLHAHGAPIEVAIPGGRVAAALRGVALDEVGVGETLCAPGGFEASPRIDVEITLAADSARPLKSGDEVRVLWGARQDIARVRLIGAGAIPAGGRGFAQLRVSAPTIAYAGERAVLRRPSPAETLGGAVVLDPVAPMLRARTLDARLALLAATSTGDLEAMVDGLAARDGGAVSVAEVARLSRRRAGTIRARLNPTHTALDADLMAPAAAVARAERAYLDQLALVHRDQPTRSWAPLGALRARLSRIMSQALVACVEQRLATSGEIRLQRGRAALRDHDPVAALSPSALARLQQIEAAFEAGGVTPPSARELADPTDDDPTLIDLLVDAGRLIALRNVALRQTVTFHIHALDAAVRTLRAAYPSPTAFTTGQARETLATSRKFIVPVLEHFDDRGDTIRQGDTRQVAGPPNPI